ncbi:tetratricopeptide repeat protein [Actinoplanes sp. CA-051413]|uniref:tetratricopeptide repeat protein n=1 Tax=Actinoplanes sp. CA-051413 TaxID=3239899 RepID=UPI003D95D445
MDYAERWPLNDLLLLTMDLQREFLGKVRVLLLARSSTWWHPLRHRVQREGWALSQIHLDTKNDPSFRTGPIFEKALERFSEVLEVPNIGALPGYSEFEHVRHESILSIHMTALATALAAMDQESAPTQSAGISTFLFDREQAYWERLKSASRISIRFSTMSRAVFGAILVGPTPHGEGATMMDRAGISSPTEPADLILEDHRSCYPPFDSTLVLQPLYPDRIAEDFIAMKIPGGPTEDFSDPWTTSALGRLVETSSDRDEDALRRMLTVLVESSRRWDHVAERVLIPTLKSNASIASSLGGAGLIRLVSLEKIDTDLLEAIDKALPRQRLIEFDAARAVIGTALYESRLASTLDPIKRAQIATDLSERLGNAGNRDGALRLTLEALKMLSVFDEHSNGASLLLAAPELGNLSGRLAELDRFEESAQAAKVALAVYRLLDRLDAGSVDDRIGSALNNLAMSLLNTDDEDGALDAALEAISIRRKLAANNAVRTLADLAASLDNVGIIYHHRDDLPSAVEASSEAVRIFRRLWVPKTDAYAWELAASLDNHGGLRWELDDRERAIEYIAESAMHFRRLTEANSDAFSVDLYKSLNNLSNKLWDLGRRDEAIDAKREALDALKDSADRYPDIHLADLVRSYLKFADWLNELEQYTELIDAADEALKVLLVRPVFGDIDTGRAIADAYSLKANALAFEGHFEESTREATNMVEAYRRLLMLGYNSSLPLAEAIRSVAARHIEGGAYSEAHDLLQEALEILRQSDDGNAATAKILAATLSTYAYLQTKSAADLTGGLKAADASISILWQIRDQSSDGIARYIVGSMRSKAEILEHLGRSDESIEIMNLLESMSDQEPDDPS